MVGAGERRRAGEHLVGQAAEGVDVTPEIERLPPDLLWGHVARRPLRLLLGPQEPGKSAGRLSGDGIVEDAHIAIGRDENVGRLHVAVHPALAMEEAEPFGDADEDLHRLGHRPLPLARRSDAAAEVRMGEQIHDETGHPLVNLQPMDTNEMGMHEVLPDAELMLELPALRLVGDKLRHQDLDRHLAAFARVKGAPHLALTAEPELLLKVERTEPIGRFGHGASLRGGK